MTACKNCELLKKEELIIFEDEQVAAILSDTPATVAHVIILPKQHYTILEQAPDEIVEKLGIVANKISTAIFESLNIGGTVVMIQNGTVAGQDVPHLSVHVFPRTENDELSLGWDTQKVSDDELSMLASQISKAVLPVGTVPVQQTVQKEVPADQIDGDDEDNYLIRQLERRP
ncbi:HIT family protein [Candidatus Woesearchaeota archaeon]|nr:HIT family protein [Candidatus Woesearchaeota archaeon]